MQVILRKDVKDLGYAGDIVKVRDGYGRNFLIPRGVAAIATDDNLKQVEHEKRVIAQGEAKRLADANALKTKLEALAINITKQVGEDSKLFGSVTNREIADALKAEGVEIDRKSVLLDQPIKALGVHEVKVRLGRDVYANLKIWVVGK